MYYFTYGSNLNKKQMQERCPEAKPRYVATLPNYKLVFSGWYRKWHGGVANIKPLRGEKVLGAIYELTDRDLRRLDNYEGYPGTYKRLNVTVFNEDGDPVEAVTYIKSEQTEETAPSKEYLVVMEQGCRDWGIIR